MPALVAGGVSPRTQEAGQTPTLYPDQLSANTTFLQTGSGGYARVSTALMALNQAQNVANLADTITTLTADVTTLQGQVATLQGQVATLQGQVAAQQITINSFNYNQAEVSTGTTYLNGATIYKRSFVPPSTILGTALTVGSYAHTVANIGYIVWMQGIASLYQGQSLPMTFVNMATAPSINIGLSIWGDQTNIYIAVGTQTFPTYTPIVTMWYTATDR